MEEEGEGETEDGRWRRREEGGGRREEGGRRAEDAIPEWSEQQVAAPAEQSPRGEKPDRKTHKRSAKGVNYVEKAEAEELGVVIY